LAAQTEAGTAPEDIFRKESQWEQTIEVRCSKELKEADADGCTTIGKRHSLSRSRIAKLAVDGEGLTINFPEYTVAPRVTPVAPVTIP